MAVHARNPFTSCGYPLKEPAQGWLWLHTNSDDVPRVSFAPSSNSSTSSPSGPVANPSPARRTRLAPRCSGETVVPRLEATAPLVVVTTTRKPTPPSSFGLSDAGTHGRWPGLTV